MNKLLLVLGPSGVGKSSIIEEIRRLDKRFISVPTYTTRPLRIQEENKISISSREMFEMRQRNELLEINKLYGNYYATPILPIINALAEDKFPVLDWPISRLGIMEKAFPGQLYVVYLSPPSMEILEQRLLNDERDINNVRLRRAHEELKAYWSGQYVNLYDLDVISHEGKQTKVAADIFDAYRLSIVSSYRRTT